MNKSSPDLETLRQEVRGRHASIGTGETVLDLGAGAGLNAVGAARAVGLAGRGLGIDMTPEMVTRARASVKKSRTLPATLPHAAIKMTAAVELRPMTEADIPTARQLWAEADGVELAEGDSVEEMSAYLRRNPGMSFVAQDGNRLIGAVLAGHDGRRGFLYHLAVTREARGARIGRTLVARSLAALKAASVVRVLILVSRDNELGQAFWSKQGWEPLTFAQPMGIDL